MLTDNHNNWIIRMIRPWPKKDQERTDYTFSGIKVLWSCQKSERKTSTNTDYRKTSHLYLHIASVLAETLLALTWLLPLQTTYPFSVEMVILTFLSDLSDALQLCLPQRDQAQSSWMEQFTVMLQNSPDRLKFIADIMMTGLGTASAAHTHTHTPPEQIN